MLRKIMKHFSALTGIGFQYYNVRMKDFDEQKPGFCGNCLKNCDYKNTHLYGCYESARWDDQYIYYCPAGFIFIAVPVYNDLDMLDGGVIAGPLLMGDLSDYEDCNDLPHMETAKVTDLAEIMSAVFSSGRPHTDNKPTGEFLNTIYKELEILPLSAKDYPFLLEKQLQTAIIEGDGARSRDLLNRLLGQIFFHSNGDYSIISVRAKELLVLLSRSAIEGGADIDQIFMLNDSYLLEIENCRNIEQLSFWLTGVINRFVSYVFDLGSVKHTDIIHKITAYINNNYMRKISLDEIAAHVYLSKSYVSKIFKDEMKIGIASFINKVRIEKSKHLILDNSLTLADVANLAGFEDQSYFTKQFKAIVGISPGKYREKHGGFV